jgi:protein phosphatase PTC7|tara:strand:+ start:2261 stop:3058 length:798 start_codon:yes stop_codon:yes gene_type:complete
MSGPSLRIEWGVSNVPHPEKGDGEDTWFTINDAKYPAAGVFDGVGSWAEQNVNPIYWSMALAEGCSASIMDGNTGPITILTDGYKNAMASKHEGSCTACVAIKNGPNSVSVANLGDSGVALFRDDKLVWESSQQEYLFNYPYQLSSDVDALPKDADRHVLTKLKSGDIIILATDGLWDNLYNKEIIKYLDDDSEVEDIATTLAVSAFHASNDQKRWGPFSQASVENLYTASPYASDEDFIPPPAPLTEYMGGKPDDITVIVGRLV